MHTIDDGIYNVYMATSVPTPDRAATYSERRAIEMSMRYGATGPCFAVASACSSGSQAVGLAMQMIRAGMIDRAIVGGSEACVTNGSMRAWESLRVLTPDLCRPFAKSRNGMVLGEGSAIFVLEAEDIARRAPRGLWRCWPAMAPTPTRSIRAPDAASASACMNMALEDAGLQPDDIDYVNAHGTATGPTTSTSQRRSTAFSAPGSTSFSSLRPSRCMAMRWAPAARWNC